MLKFSASARRIALISCWSISLCCAGFDGAAFASSATQNSGQSQQSQPRPKKPKLKPGSGFEQYAGKDASSRLIAGGATRGPLKPFAPLEGLAYNDRPFFRWEGSPGVAAYRFELHDGGEISDPTIYTASVPAPHFVYPDDAPQLQPGKVYSWRVSVPGVLGVKKFGGLVRFTVLAKDEATELDAALKKANLAAPKTNAERLRRATMFKDYGVWYDALAIVSQLLTENPGDAAAQKLLDELRAKLSGEQDKIKADVKPTAS